MHAEDNGFFVSAGYQIGEAVQMVKNTGELKNLNEKYEQLNQYLNQVASLKQSIQNANNIELVNSSLNYLKSFTNNNYNSTTQSPIFNAVQAVITSVLGFGVFMRGTTSLFLWLIRMLKNALMFRVTLLLIRLYRTAQELKIALWIKPLTIR
ncbi:sialic acid-binding adhesin SabA domain protein [Helicobacter pylori Hp H-28]|nr:sialic acid-binding adhesin SabA domain protein [Helicobacter pylori Hp H-28]